VLVYLALVFSLALMIVLWAIGVNPFDALMLAIAITLGAACVRIITPFLPGNRGRDD